MPNDTFGVKKIYPDSTKNPQSFYLKNPDSRVRVVDGGSGELVGSNTTGEVAITNPGPVPHVEVYTPAGYVSSKIEKNHDKCATRGFMMDARDWRNIEATAYFWTLPNESAEGGIIWAARGGSLKNKGSSNCEAFAYMSVLGYGGQLRFTKQQHSTAAFRTNFVQATNDIEGRWIGYKFCCFDDGSSKVRLECYVDENESNSWKKVGSYTDTGQWGSAGSNCGTVSDQLGLWGGPVVSLILSDGTQVKWKKFSVREVDPGGVFNEGGSNIGGGLGNGGTGSTGSGGNGGSTQTGTGSVSRCVSSSTNTKSNVSINTKSNSGTNSNPNPTDVSGSSENKPPASAASNNNSNDAQGGGNVDRYGVKSVYARGQIIYDFEIDNNSGGRRFDFRPLGSSIHSYETIGYFKHSGSIDDEVAGILKGGRHSSGSKPRSYSVGIHTSGSPCRYRTEETHPNYSAGQSGNGSGQGGGKALGSSWVGYNFVARNVSNGVLLEIWQDQGNNEGSQPANQWKKIASWVDTKKNWRNPPSDHKTTIRIDDIDNLSHKWLSVRVIQEGDSTTASTGGTNNSGPNSTTTTYGGSGGGGDGSGGCCCSCDVKGGKTGTGDDSCDTSTGGDPNTPGAGVEVEIPPIETLASDLTVIYHIAVDTEHDDNCTSGNPLEVRGYESILDSPPEDDTFVDLGYNTGLGTTAVGLIVANTESTLYNKILRKITIKGIVRTVDEETETCTGDLYCRVRNTSDNEIKYQFGDEIDIATLGTSEYEEIEFVQDDNKEPLKVGDMILLEYYDNSAASDKCLKVQVTGKDVVDGPNTYLVYKKTTGYVFSERDKDWGFEAFI
jgi:hypothetical protein